MSVENHDNPALKDQMTVGPRTAKALRFFGHVWLGLFVCVWLVSAAFHIYSAPSTWQGIQDVLWWVAPWNIAGFIVTVLSLAPALIAYSLAGKHKRVEANMAR